jgi:very-short-patch-repair endonuclease
MAPLNRDLLAWSAGHHVVVTTQVLKAHGVGPAQLKRLVADGTLERLLDGTYRFTAAPTSFHQRCVAACARPAHLVVEGPSAGRLWVIRRMPPSDDVWVIGPPASNPSLAPWLRVYRTALLLPEHVVERPDGIRLTSPARTAVDLVRHLSLVDVRSVIDQIVQRELATVEQMHEVAESLNTPGRPWARTFLRLLAARPDGGAPESHWESVVANEFVRQGVTGLVTQYWLDVPTWGPVRFDLAVPRLRWAIEIDGFPDHFTEDGSTRDAGRDLACAAIGWTTSRVTALGLRRDTSAVIESLLRVYRARTAAPHER